MPNSQSLWGGLNPAFSNLFDGSICHPQHTIKSICWMVKSVKSQILGQIPTFFQFWAGKSHHFLHISQDLYREIHRQIGETRRYTVAFADRNAAAKSKAEILG